MPPRWSKAELNESDNTANISIYSEIGGWGVGTQAFADELKALDAFA